MPTEVIPLTLAPNTRHTGTGFNRGINVIPELFVDQLSQRSSLAARKRPGLLSSTQPPGGAATGRGVHHWAATGKIYSASNNQIYSGTTNLGVTLAGSSGRVWFVETPATSSEQILIASDGSDNYHITTGDTIDTIDENDNAQYPASNLGCILHLDAYILQAQASGRLWNTDQNNFDAWRAQNFVSANAKGDALEAIAGVRNRVLAMGKRSIESYWNRGNRYGSPLLRIEESRLSHGIASKNTLGQVGDLLAYVGETAGDGDGGRSVWLMQAGAAKEVSSPVVNRLLAAEGSSISSATAWIERVAGHLLYVLNLSSADRSLVYDIDTGQWFEWGAAGVQPVTLTTEGGVILTTEGGTELTTEGVSGGGVFQGAYVTSKDGVLYVQHATNGKIYTLNGSTHEDDGVSFTVTWQTDPKDQGTSGTKDVSVVELDADTEPSGTATLAVSDDEGTTWTTVGVFDLTLPYKAIRDVGQYEGGRMWRLTHSADGFFRFRALRLHYQFGAY